MKNILGDAPPHTYNAQRKNKDRDSSRPPPPPPPPRIPLSIEDCFRILELYKDWDVSQKNTTLLSDDARTHEDDVFDERRALLAKIYKRLNKLV